jgi:hypothetical protein
VAPDLTSAVNLYGPTVSTLSFLANHQALVAAASGAGHGAEPNTRGATGGLTTSAPGPSGGGGFSLSLFILLAFIGVAASRLRERLLSAPAQWRPVAFVSLLERPG